jgi:O-antigen/teichoic acid export membrane protein
VKKNRLFKAAAGTFGLKVSSAAFAFLVNLLLTRLLGVEKYGVYVYAWAWVNLLTVPAALGLDLLFIRQIAVYHAQQAWPLLQGITRWATQLALGSACLLGLAFAGLAVWIAPNLEVRIAIWIGLLALPMMAIRNLRICTMKGLDQVVRGGIPETVAYPLILMALSGLGYKLFRPYFSVYWVMGSVVLTSLLTLGLGLVLLRQVWPRDAQKAPPQYQPRQWFKATLPFLMLGVITIINSKVAVLTLGAWRGTELSGVYAIADQISVLISFFLIAINGTLAPTIAKTYAAGNFAELQKIIRRCARVTVITMVPTALGVMLLAPWILKLFGQEFVAGTESLRILCIGQIINASTGSVGLILNMTGHEKYNVMSLSLGTGINLLLNLLLVPQFGLIGAAIAAATSMIVWNLC